MTRPPALLELIALEERLALLWDRGLWDTAESDEVMDAIDQLRPTLTWGDLRHMAARRANNKRGW